MQPTQLANRISPPDSGKRARASVRKEAETITQLDDLLPETLRNIPELNRALPKLAKDCQKMAETESLLKVMPTRHELVPGDARTHRIRSQSIHLVVTLLDAQGIPGSRWTARADERLQLGQSEVSLAKLFSCSRAWRSSCVRSRRCLFVASPEWRPTYRGSTCSDSGTMPEHRLRQPVSNHLAQNRQRTDRGPEQEGLLPREALRAKWHNQK